MTEARTRLDLLPTTYPRLFADGPPTWGFEYGDGWTELIEALCARISKILEREPATSMQVVQVKEKFGTLRFYYRLYCASDEMAELIRAAVDRAGEASGQICERCGRTAKLSTNEGWWSTLCPRCCTDST
jgi:hypothetical protein